MNFFTHILNGKKTIVGLIGFVGCKVLARALPEAGEACEMLADYVFAPLAGLGAWHKLAKIEGARAANHPDKSDPPRKIGGNGAVFEKFGRLPAFVLAVSLAATTLTGCASLQGQGLARGITEAARDALEGAAEEANLRKHLREFFEDVGELLFGEEEIEAETNF